MSGVTAVRSKTLRGLRLGSLKPIFGRSPVFLRMHVRALSVAVVAILAIVTAITQLPLGGAEAEATEAATQKGQAHAKFERWATITKTSYGYYYDAGQQDTHLVLSLVNGRVRFADTHTDVIRSKPNGCNKKRARAGSVVVCRVPGNVSARNPMTLRVFTRLGNDNVKSTALPPAFKLYMLADAGRDVVRAGPGNDFINGAQNRDRMWGGAGNDWIRTGLGNDDITGGAGRDRLVGVYGEDTIHGGRGNDRIGGGPGKDRLNATAGKDHVLCGTGRDRARADRSDTINRDCESVNFG